tara:strand:+ start:121 stop:516 length:396 start_codon:yes stop_codon:yes gene_type:complete
MSYVRSKMSSSDEPSFQQSQENYTFFKDNVKNELESTIIFKVTHVNVIDTFFKKELINSEFHKLKLRECILEDRREEVRDMFYSMLVAGLLITSFLIFIVPHDQYYIFRFLYLLYISIIYFLAFLFYRKLV